MPVVTLFTNFAEAGSTYGKVDMSCSRVAALHCAEDCIDRHIRGAGRVDRNAGQSMRAGYEVPAHKYSTVYAL